MQDTAASLADPQAPLSQTARVVNTFIEPSKTFHDIRRNRSWWLPFLILAVLGYGFVFAAVQHVGWDSLITNVMRSNPRSAERLNSQTPAQQAQTFAFTKGIMEASMAASPLLLLGMRALFALLLWIGFAFVLGGATNYGDMFAVSIFSALPNALASLIAIVTAFVGDPQTYNIALPSPSSLGYFLSADAPAWLKSLGGSLDLFSLWSLVLAGFGAAIVAKVKPARGLLLVFIAWTVYVLGKVGLSAAF